MILFILCQQISFGCISTFTLDDNDITTILTSNVSTRSPKSYKAPALDVLLKNNKFSGDAFCLKTDNTIADSGATQIFVMAGTPVVNKQKTSHPLGVSLADDHQVMSTHMCDINITGLPVVLTGHMIPDLSIASHFLVFE
jgi:hypothetical protein